MNTATATAARQHVTIPTSRQHVNTGALVWAEGYRWRVMAVTEEADRHVFLAIAADAPGRTPAPAVYRDSMTLGYGGAFMVSVEAGTNEGTPATGALSAAELAEADALTRAVTCFDSLADMADASGHYRPSMHTSERNTDNDRARLLRLADLYDRHQAARGDDRRAYRY